MNEFELEKIKKKALQDNIPIIMDDTLQTIDTILKKLNITKILEIGTAVGYSAICLTRYLNEKGSIDTIERDVCRIEEAKKNIELAEVDNKIHILEGDAVDILPTLNEKYDVIFIDAAKGKYPFFLKEATRLIKSGGIILADNVLYKGYVLGNYNKHKQRTAVTHLREYLKEVKENPKFETEILDVGDGLSISKVKNS